MRKQLGRRLLFEVADGHSGRCRCGLRWCKLSGVAEKFVDAGGLRGGGGLLGAGCGESRPLASQLNESKAGDGASLSRSLWVRGESEHPLDYAGMDGGGNQGIETVRRRAAICGGGEGLVEDRLE